METSNPHGYEPSWTIEQHRDELIERLGNAIKRINELEEQVEEARHEPWWQRFRIWMASR
jgi:vacuolar-type H+-ATPase subunit D/Vma8